MVKQRIRFLSRGIPWGTLARLCVLIDMRWYWAPQFVDTLLLRFWRFCWRMSEEL